MDVASEPEVLQSLDQARVEAAALGQPGQIPVRKPERFQVVQGLFEAGRDQEVVLLRQLAE